MTIWTSKDETILVGFCYRITWAQLGLLLHRTATAVRDKANQLGLHDLKDWSKDLDKSITNSYNKGESLDQIAERLCTHPKIIAARALALHLISCPGLKPPSSPVSCTDPKLAKALAHVTEPK